MIKLFQLQLNVLQEFLIYDIINLIKFSGFYMLAVYDVQKEKFRELDETNCDDDLTVGVVFLKRESLEIIKKKFYNMWVYFN